MSESRVEVTHLIKLELTSKELHALKDAVASKLSQVTDRHMGGSDNDARAETLRWLLGVLSQ